MRTPTLRKRRQADPDPETESEIETREDDPPRAQTVGEDLQWTGGAAFLTKVTTGALWLAVACGPLALALVWLAFAAPTPAVTSQQLAGDVDVAERAAVTSFAENFVTTWLTTPQGQENRLSGLITSASNISLPQKVWVVDTVSTSAVQETAPDLWSVTVAASVSRPGKGSTRPVRRYFQVPVHSAAGAVIAQTLPAPVPAPPAATPDQLDYRYRANLAEPAVAAAQDFLTALLTGTGDVSRYIAPGAAVTAVTPTPYTALEVEEALVDEDLTDAVPTPETGDQLRLLVSATAIETQASQISVQYALTLTARDGRWEVSAIDPAPRVSERSTDAGTPAPSSTDEARSTE